METATNKISCNLTSMHYRETRKVYDGKIFGDWLKASRHLNGMTQQELADAVNRLGRDEDIHIGKQYISQLERNMPHWKTGRSVRPSEALVDTLALAMNSDRREARKAAGYDPDPARGGLFSITADGDTLTVNESGEIQYATKDDIQRIERILSRIFRAVQKENEE